MSGPADTAAEGTPAEPAGPATGDTWDTGTGPAAPEAPARDVEPAGADAEVPGGQGRGGPGSSQARLAVAAATAVLGLPIAVALAAVRTPRWYPLVDLAQIEMRVRDVGTAHSPLVGLGGRIFGLDTQGAHPGPVSFYLLAPVYRLLGGTSWALQVSAATLNVAALAATLWATSRRWGAQGVLLVAAGLAVLLRLYGTAILVYPWNPYMPVLFWVLFLVCVWGVLCGDLPLLPVAVVAGSVCAQTHLPYVPLVGGSVLVVAVALVARHRRAAGDAPARRAIRRWSALAAGLGTLLWLPVLVQQVGGDPPNVSVIIDAIGDPAEDPAGAGTAWRLLTEHLDVTHLLSAGGAGGGGSSAVGIALLVAWGVAAAVAVKRGERTLVRLHAVVAVALVFGLVAISRILGVTWFYLTLWAYGTAALALVATVATALRPGRGTWWPPRGRGARVAAAALAAAVVVPTALLVADAPATEDADAEASALLGRVVGPTVRAIEDGTVPGGPDATYYVTWDDPVNLGGMGLGLMLELERRGYRVRAQDEMRINVRPHRVAPPDETDAAIHLATGSAAIDRALAEPGLREIVLLDPRTPEQAARYERLRDRVVAELEERGLDDLADQVDQNILVVGNDDRLPAALDEPVRAMAAIPPPVAVFAGEPVR